MTVQDESRLKIEKFLTSAKNNFIATESLFEIFENDLVEVHLHVVRCCYFLSQFDRLMSDLNVLDISADWITEIEKESFWLPQKISFNDWQKMLSESLPTSEANYSIDRKKLTIHIQILENNLKLRIRKYRKKYNIKIVQKMLAKFFYIFIASIVIGGLGAALFLGIRAYKKRNDSWVASIYNNINLEGEPILIETIPNVNYNWGSSPFENFPTQNFSATFYTCFIVEEAGDLMFTLGSDDGSRLFINGVLLIDAWIDQGFTERATTQHFKPGVYLISIDYFQGGYDARSNLKITDKNNEDFKKAKFSLPIEGACKSN